MIALHKLNGFEVVVNAELLEMVEAHGTETVLHLTTGNRIVVKESVADVIAKTVAYRQSANAGAEARRDSLCHSPLSQ